MIHFDGHCDGDRDGVGMCKQTFPVLYNCCCFHSQLVGRANTWLQSNPSYSIINCETVVQYWARSHGYNPYRVIATRSKVQADVTVCMHILRLVAMETSLLILINFI